MSIGLSRRLLWRIAEYRLDGADVLQQPRQPEPGPSLGRAGEEGRDETLEATLQRTIVDRLDDLLIGRLARREAELLQRPQGIDAGCGEDLHGVPSAALPIGVIGER